MGDLELLHHFLTSTCIATAQKPEVTARIQSSVPALAQAHPFVMRGILAMAATHLSRLRPQRQQYYAMIAAKNHSIALPDFRSALQNIHEGDCHALISYSKSLVWCSFASHEAADRNSVSEGKQSWIPEWFHLLRGSCRIVNASMTWLKVDPHARYINQATIKSNTTHNHPIALLRSQLRSVTEYPSSNEVCSVLEESFAQASLSNSNTPLRNAVNHWMGLIPDEYLQLLQVKEPWALIVLAHFCVLVHRSETVWFMKWNAKRLMLLILERLDVVWWHHVSWPISELGIGVCEGPFISENTIVTEKVREST
jgi:hypothetical protein